MIKNRSSSTKIRKAVAEDEEGLERLMSRWVGEWVIGEGLYRGSGD